MLIKQSKISIIYYNRRGRGTQNSPLLVITHKHCELGKFIEDFFQIYLKTMILLRVTTILKLRVSSFRMLLENIRFINYLPSRKIY